MNAGSHVETCAKGHVMDDANVMLQGGKYRRCRECIRLQSRQRHHRYATYSVADRPKKKIRQLKPKEAQLVLDHIGLAKWCAVKFVKQLLVSEDLEECMQDAFVALVEAAQTYDSRSKYAFSTYAVFEMRTAMRDGRLVREGKGKRYVWDNVERDDFTNPFGVLHTEPSRNRQPDDIAIDRIELERIAAWLTLDSHADDIDRALVRGLLDGKKDVTLAESVGVSKATAHRRVVALRQRLGGDAA